MRSTTRYPAKNPLHEFIHEIGNTSTCWVGRTIGEMTDHHLQRHRSVCPPLRNAEPYDTLPKKQNGTGDLSPEQLVPFRLRALVLRIGYKVHDLVK